MGRVSGSGSAWEGRAPGKPKGPGSVRAPLRVLRAGLAHLPLQVLQPVGLRLQVGPQVPQQPPLGGQRLPDAQHGAEGLARRPAQPAQPQTQRSHRRQAHRCGAAGEAPAAPQLPCAGPRLRDLPLPAPGQRRVRPRPAGAGPGCGRSAVASGRERHRGRGSSGREGERKAAAGAGSRHRPRGRPGRIAPAAPFAGAGVWPDRDFTGAPIFVADSSQAATGNSEEDTVDEEEEEEEENVQQASRGSILPNNQDLGCQPPPRTHCCRTVMVGKAPLLQMFQRSPYHLRPRG
ncbi:uncharacterized protein [Lepidochelys kempii]|uniref:uncharacterized protein n=1 Tax=Lepidochelys kempii TaxID=8472 RepID=UPI003C704141